MFQTTQDSSLILRDNQSEQGSFYDVGLGEDRDESLYDSVLSVGHNWRELRARTIATQPPYSVDELMDLVEIIVYCFGFLSNTSVLVVFFKDGLSSSSNIGFFSLALADLSVCIFQLVYLIADWILHYYEFIHNFWWISKFEESSATFSAWITAVICWERLCGLTFPEKVKRIITPKFTTCMIYGYMSLLVVESLEYYVAWAIRDYIQNDLCSNFYDYDEHEWRFSMAAAKMIDGAEAVRDYLMWILIWTPNMIAYALVLVGNFLFMYILFLKQSMCVRKSLAGEKKQNNSAKETRLTQSVFVVCLIFIFASAPRSIHRMLKSLFINVDKFFIHASFMLSAINHSTTFFIHLAFNSRFRKILCNIFLFKRQTVQN